MSWSVPSVFGSGGALSGALPGFHPRPAQIRMAEIVSEVLAKGLFGIVEAGTGTGKSLAYLLPALALLPEDARIIVSTQTIHLQQQIVAKDLPLAAGILPRSPKTALMLGRNNYLCRRKIVRLMEDASSLTPEERRFFLDLLDGVERGRGNRHEQLFTAEAKLWSLFASESETCLRGRCLWYAECFWQQARKEAFEAGLVVVNHHLFFSDLALRARTDWATEHALLPPYQYVVFDEAHHLEDVATEYLGFHWREEDFLRRLERLLRRDGQRRDGWLPGLRNRILERASELSTLQEQLGLLNQAVIPSFQELELQSKEFFRLLERFVREKNATSEEGFVWRFKTNLADLLPEAQPSLDMLMQSLHKAEQGVSSLVDALENAEPGGEDAVFLAETGRNLAELQTMLPLLWQGDDRAYVHWIGCGPDGKVSLHRVPLQIGPLFHETFLSLVDGAVFTSATLSVGGSFDYFRERLGLDRVHPSQRREEILPPAFDYRRQALIIGVRDLPEPDSPSFVSGVAEILPEILQATHGRAFVLFTSKQQMTAVYRKVAAALRTAGLTLFCQSDANRHKLLERFKAAEAPVLFGMDSFWEGVDIPGDQLSCVVLVRLPFRVPTEPVQEARYENIRSEGANAFKQYSLPQAILRFKQGFGRLIRTREDRGVVVVLDSRLANKQYGRDFLDSLPGGTFCLANRKEITAMIKDWAAI